jgi:peptidoglycan lytic transglycosylase
MNRVVSSLAAAVVLVAGMAAAPVPDRPQKAPTKTPPPKGQKIVGQKLAKRNRAPVADVKPYQVGMASWYGKQFHGKATASGEDFDMFELTAAHRNLPLGTYLKVTNLRNGKSIVVRVNDRGPYVGDRVIDLSYSASRMLSFRSGVERVRLDIIQPETVAQVRSYSKD